MDEEPLVIFLSGDDDPEKVEEKRKSKELKSLWKKAIHQQILLLRMEKENQKLEGQLLKQACVLPVCSHSFLDCVSTLTIIPSDRITSIS
jgi:hypothetical protein